MFPMFTPWWKLLFYPYSSWVIVALVLFASKSPFNFFRFNARIILKRVSFSSLKLITDSGIMAAHKSTTRVFITHLCSCLPAWFQVNREGGGFLASRPLNLLTFSFFHTVQTGEVELGTGRWWGNEGRLLVVCQTSQWMPATFFGLCTFPKQPENDGIRDICKLWIPDIPYIFFSHGEMYLRKWSAAGLDDLNECYTHWHGPDLS